MKSAGKDGIICMDNTTFRAVIISSIVSRKDVNVEGKRQKVNHLTKSMCEKNGFKFLSNENIDHSHLWRDGLHLSNRGLNVLADNLIGVINNSL